MWLFFFFLIIDIALIDAASSSRTTTVPNSKKAVATKLTRNSIPRTTSGSRFLGKTKVGPPVNDENEEMMKKVDKTLKVLFAVSVALIPVLRRIDDEGVLGGMLCLGSLLWFLAMVLIINDYVSKNFFESNTPPQIMSKVNDVISTTYKYALFGFVAIIVSKFLDFIFIVWDIEAITTKVLILIGLCGGMLLSKGPKWAQDCLQILCNVSLALTVILMVISYCKRSWWNQVVSGF